MKLKYINHKKFINKIQELNNINQITSKKIQKNDNKNIELKQQIIIPSDICVSNQKYINKK